MTSPLLVSRDTNPWERLHGECFPIIPVATARRLSPSPWNSLSATCNVSQFFPGSLRPPLIHHLQPDASSGILVTLMTKTGSDFSMGTGRYITQRNNTHNATLHSHYPCKTNRIWHFFHLIGELLVDITNQRQSGVFEACRTGCLASV